MAINALLKDYKSGSSLSFILEYYYFKNCLFGLLTDVAMAIYESAVKIIVIECHSRVAVECFEANFSRTCYYSDSSMCSATKVVCIVW